MLDAATSYAALRSGVVAFTEAREVIIVRGTDALSFLEGQVSQAITGLAPGDAAEALVLTPAGKIEAAVRVARLGELDALLEVEAGYGEALLERLRRFKIRVKAELVLEPAVCTRVVGPRAAEVAGGLAVPGWPGPVALVLTWPGLTGLDLLATEAVPLPDVEAGDPAAFEAARIEAGMPRMAGELTGGVIPQEAGVVSRTVSFTKGCYTGQELVARIDARGNRVPRLLRGLRLRAEAGFPELGTPLHLGEREVGKVTSLAGLPAGEGAVGLAYVRREVEPPAPVELGGPGGPAIEVRPLPLVDG